MPTYSSSAWTAVEPSLLPFFPWLCGPASSYAISCSCKTRW